MKLLKNKIVKIYQNFTLENQMIFHKYSKILSKAQTLNLNHINLCNKTTIWNYKIFQKINFPIRDSVTNITNS